MDQAHEFIHPERLLDPGTSTRLKKGASLSAAAVAGSKDDVAVQVWMPRDHGLPELLTIHLRHTKVRDDQVDAVPLY
jgi:hypothetical protein